MKSIELKAKRRGRLTQANRPRLEALTMGKGWTDGIIAADIEWVDEEGYRVSGIFQLIGWN